MSDPVTAAKTARESLSRALAALQSDPNVPQELMAVAEPVSGAMGALFQIERSGGAAAGASGPQALEAVRKALALLQQQPSNHPAVQVALEAVAGSLSLVHGIAAAAAVPKTIPDQPPAQAPAPQPAAYAPPQQYAQQPYAQPQPYAAQKPAMQPDAAYAATFIAPVGTAAHLAAGGEPKPGPQGVPIRVEAELGAHSPSNFYKGLSGNDVVEHGGLFVATYKVLPVGQSVALHVSLPGGYEFDAVGVVRWTREPMDGEQPGFGAQLVQLSPEARQLVYRYVRNREPLFHDDM